MTASQTKNERAGDRLVLLLILVVVGLFIAALQSSFYQRHPPFFDSVSYYDRLYEVMSIQRQQGFVAAVAHATLEDSTFCLPYLLAIPLSWLVPPSLVPPTRLVGVAIEMFYLAVFVFSLAEYLRHVHRATSRQIVVGLLPIFLLNALYRYNSGLSDLRVDLPLAFLYAAIGCWWLMGLHLHRWRYFAVAGILAGMACLTRGLAPLYLAVGFLPLVVFELFRTAEKSKRLLQAALVIGLAAVLAGWFYVVQFEFIYYYYAVWNTDANAGVPWPRTLRHGAAALRSIGALFLLHAAVVLILERRYRPASSPASDSGENDDRRDRAGDALRFLWLGAAPLLLLIGMRTDVNPFVSLPAAVAGSVAILLALRPRMVALLREAPGLLVAVNLILIGLAWTIGWLDHTKHPGTALKAHQEILRIMEADARSSGRTKVAYGVNLITRVNASSLDSLLQSDRDAIYVDTETVEIKGLRFTVDERLTNPSQANWDRIAGETMDQKIRSLEQLAAAEIDYVVTLVPDSVSAARQWHPQDHAVRYADQIVAAFLDSGSWQVISPPLDIGRGIEVQLLRNQSRAR